MEPESLSAWQTGKHAFMRNWPYAYGISEDTAKLKGKFAVAPLPSYAGAGKASILGGGNSVISTLLEEPRRRARRRRLPRLAGLADDADGRVLADVAVQGDVRPARR